MSGPTFFVVGAGRSGTTALHHYLGQHPEIFVTREKSPNFFISTTPSPEWELPEARRMARQWVSTRSAYDRLFAAVTSERAVGDISPTYLQARTAAGAIASAFPKARIVAVLRDPVERAHAHWLGRRRDGIESRADFRSVIDLELARGLPDEVAFGSYLGIGRYAHFLRSYLELFPSAHVRIYLYDDFRDDVAGLLRDLAAFLGVDPGFTFDTSARFGQTGTIRNPLGRALWTRSTSLRTTLRPYLPRTDRDRALPLVSPTGLDRPPLDPELRSRMLAAVRGDIVELQTLIDRDLSAWLANDPTG